MDATLTSVSSDGTCCALLQPYFGVVFVCAERRQRCLSVRQNLSRKALQPNEDQCAIPARTIFTQQVRSSSQVQMRTLGGIEPEEIRARDQQTVLEYAKITILECRQNPSHISL